jgi:hypothetical protein
MVAHELNVGRQKASRLPGAMARRSIDPFIVRHVMRAVECRPHQGLRKGLALPPAAARWT